MPALLLALMLGGCGDDDPTPTDGGTTMDSGMQTDAGPPQSIDDLPVAEDLNLAGLGAEVNAIRDNRGMWHIYADDMVDASRVLGYLQAKDRLGQMEMIRRQATGRLAHFAGSLDSSLLQTDIDSRFAGFARIAEQTLPTVGSDERAMLDAFSEGISIYVERIQDGSEELPEGVDAVLQPETFTPWTPVETLAIARLQAAALSFDGNDDIGNTMNLRNWVENFPADSDDPRVARLAGAMHDIYSFRPIQRSYNLNGFPNEAEDTGTRAFPLPDLPRNLERMNLPSLGQLQGAAERFGQIESDFVRLFGDETRGSNSWVISGDHTESGHPIMANDPHLALTSPPLFYQAHLNTKRAGGDIDVAGQMIAGTPAIILGFTDRIAWGLTTSGYDVTDVYLETITPGEDGAPDTVLFDGEQVPIETITETIELDIGSPREVVFEVVPHHGLIIPETRTETSAISVRWTGNTPSNEPGAFFKLYAAANILEARDAWRDFEVGGQTVVVADREGGTLFTSSVNIPVRDSQALTYDPNTYMGASPCFVLDGRGEHEWEGMLDNRLIPHEINPTRGWHATANADPVGVTDDNNPHNDAAFIGCSFDNGNRLGRIQERLEELVARGNITPEEMSELQNDATSPLGRMYSAFIVAQLDRALAERATPDTHADLREAVAAAGATMDRVQLVRDRLAAWTSFDTPAAVEGSPGPDEIADSTATSIFNTIYAELMHLTFNDEFDLAADGMLDGNLRRSNVAARAMSWMIREPSSLRSFSAEFDPDGDGEGDSVFWDDIGTEAVESKGERVLAATLAALSRLESTFETSQMDDWRWGQLHTLRLNALVPAGIVGRDPLSIPTPDDAQFPNGFPRQGDRDVVDASNFGDFSFDGIDYSSGPQQRLVVEMTPDGPEAYNAFPGGNSEDPNSQFHRDQMELWRNNQVERVPFTEEEVLEHFHERFRFRP